MADMEPLSDEAYDEIVKGVAEQESKATTSEQKERIRLKALAAAMHKNQKTPNKAHRKTKATIAKDKQGVKQKASAGKASSAGATSANPPATIS